MPGIGCYCVIVIVIIMIATTIVSFSGYDISCCYIGITVSKICSSADGGWIHVVATTCCSCSKCNGSSTSSGIIVLVV